MLKAEGARRASSKQCSACWTTDGFGRDAGFVIPSFSNLLNLLHAYRLNTVASKAAFGEGTASSVLKDEERRGRRFLLCPISEARNPRLLLTLNSRAAESVQTFLRCFVIIVNHTWKLSDASDVYLV